MIVLNKNQTNRLLGYPADARLLIINADDFGMCHAINAAIFRTLKKGVASRLVAYDLGGKLARLGFLRGQRGQYSTAYTQRSVVAGSISVRSGLIQACVGKDTEPCS